MFELRTQHMNNPVQPFDHLGPMYDTYGSLNFDSKIRKKTQSYENFRNWEGGGLQFRPDVTEDDSGVCSPPLWGTKSATQSPVHSREYDNNIPNLSPKSRTEAINRGRLELMEMVKAMPESSYELSLKDLVDNYHRPAENIEEFKSLSKKSGSKGERKPKIVRSGSNINDNNKGLFLKMVFPVSFRGSNKKKTNIINNPYSRVHSKASTTSDVDDKSTKFVEKEWWKKRSSVSDESESGGMSGSTGSSGSSGSSISSRSIRSNSSRKKSGCLNGFPIFYSKKNKSAK